MANQNKTIHYKTPSVYDIIAGNQVQRMNEDYQQKVNNDYNAWLKTQQQTVEVDDTFAKQVNDNYNAWLASQKQPSQSAQPSQQIEQPTIKQIKAETKPGPEKEEKKTEIQQNKKVTGFNKLYGQELPSLEQAKQFMDSKNKELENGIKQLDLTKYKEALAGTKKDDSDKAFKYMEDHPDEAYYVSKYLDEHNNQMDGLDYKKYLEQQKKYEQAQAFLNPNYKMTKEEEKWAEKNADSYVKMLSSKKNRTAEEEKQLQTWKDLYDKTDEATSAWAGLTDEGVKIARGIGDIAIKGLELSPKSQYQAAAQSYEPLRNAFYEQWDSPEVQNRLQNQAIQNPIADLGGRFATQAMLYGATNPIFDTAAGAAGLTGLPAWGANQIAQLGQDVVLDIAPSYAEKVRDGDLSQDDIISLASQFGWDAVGNMVMGTPDLIRKVKAAKAVADAAEPAIREVDNAVAAAQKQYDEAAANLENISKQLNEQVAKADAGRIPEMDNPRVEMEAPNIPEVEDYSKMWADNAPKIEQPEIKAPETTNVIPNIAENTQKAASKPKNLDLPDDVVEKASSDFEEIYNALGPMRVAAEATENANVIAKYEKLSKAVSDYEKAVFRVDSTDEVIKAKKAADAARQGFIREMKKIDPKYTGELTGTKLGNAAYRRTSMLGDAQANQELADSFINDELDLRKVNGDNRFAVDAEPERQKVFRGPTEKVEGAEPLQTFAEPGETNGKWRTSKARTNTFENQGWGEELPKKDYAYRVYSEAEQNADALARADSFNDLIYKDSFDEVDVKQAMNEIQSLMDSGDTKSANRLAKKLAFEGREGGRKVQAFAEYNRNSAVGAITDATKMQDDSIIQPWITQNKKQAEGNSRIARALADMGNKWKGNKATRELTHDEIRKGVIAELEREVGSVEKYFNENEIEFLTTLAEDKSIPVWKITSEIEHKLNTGNWYTLDESLPIPQPTNKKLQSALNSLITDEVRATEKAAPSLKDINKEVRNTLSKEFADFEGQFSENDIDYLANLIGNGATKQEITDALNTKLATGNFGISDETLQEVNNIFKQISNYDPNSKQFVEGQLEAYRLLANEVVGDASPMEKFEAWRYLAMLGNPKTMIRNFIGNQTFGAVTGISNNIAALAEAGVDRTVKAFGGDGIQRTKAVLNPIADSGLIKASSIDADASRYRQIVGSKYEKMDKDALRRSKSVFKSKLAQLYEKAVDAGISDYKAVKNKYSTSLAGYLKANGYGTDIFKAEDELARLKNLQETQLLSGAERQRIEDLTKEVAELNKARDYALKQAEYATFHEDNDLAKLLTETSRKARNSDNLGARMLGTVIEGTVPFKKTPANILRSGIEYSPLGAIDSISKTGKLIYENTGKRAGNLADTYIKKGLLSGKEKEVARTFASDVIDSWAKTLTGTGLTALGFYLHNKGILHSSDPDTKYQDQLEGHQNYAIEINGKSYTVDWAAPSIMPLMIGAEVSKLWDSTGQDTKDFYSNIDKYVAAANRIADPIVETSMLQGVKDTLETAANAAKYDENLNIPALIAYNSATGYLSQGVPTAAGQIARTIDPVRRSTYTDKEGVAGVIDKQLKKTMNKVPGLSMLNEPYVNTYGETQMNSPFSNPAASFAYQSLSPGYLSNIRERSADKASREAYDINKDTKTLPEYKSTFKIDGERVSPEKYTKASKIYGNAELSMRTELANNKTYQQMDKADQEVIMKKVNTLAEKKAMEAIDPNFKASEEYSLYKKSGIKGIVEKYKSDSDYNTAISDTGLKKTEKTKTIFQEEGAKGLETLESFQSYGKENANYAYNRYQTAKDKIPGLTVNQYKETVDKMDGLDGEKKNGQISQKELVAYLNNGNYTQEEAEKLYYQYGNDWKSVLYINKKGQWATKRNK